MATHEKMSSAGPPSMRCPVGLTHSTRPPWSMRTIPSSTEPRMVWMYSSFDATRTRFRTAIACLSGCGQWPAAPPAQGIDVVEDVAAIDRKPMDVHRPQQSFDRTVSRGIGLSTDWRTGASDVLTTGVGRRAGVGNGCRCQACQPYWPPELFEWLARLMGCPALTAGPHAAWAGQTCFLSAVFRRRL